MNTAKYYLHDGNIITSQQTPEIDYRSMIYGELIPELLFADGSSVYFLKEHYDKIIRTLNFFDLGIPEGFEFVKLERLISKLLNANKFLTGSIIKILITKKQSENLKSTSYFVLTEKAESHEFLFNRKGLIIGLYKGIKKPVNDLSRFRFSNNYFYLKASLFIKENNYNDCLLINENDHIVETVSSNICFVKDGTIYYPSLNEGRCISVMQEKIIELAVKTGYQVIEGCRFSYHDIWDIDEIFLIDDISPVKWVVAFEDKRFYNKISSSLYSNFDKIINKGKL